MMMNPRISRSVAALFLLIAAVLACKSGTTTSETDKANKLVDDGNAAGQDAKKFVAHAGAKKTQMIQTAVRRLAETRRTAPESIAADDPAAEKCKTAAPKYDQAS